MITYEQAREMSIWRWEFFPTGRPTYDDWRKAFPKLIPILVTQIRPSNDCGFCEFFLTKSIISGIWCDKCPLRQDDAHPEKGSAYNNDSLPCSRSFWHWEYWKRHGSIEKMEVYAAKLLEEIKASPEHLEGESNAVQPSS